MAEKLTRDEWQYLRDRAVAIVNQRPGLTTDRLGMAIGLPFKAREKGGTPRASHSFSTLLSKLVAEGAIELRRDSRAGKFDYPYVFPPGYEKPKRRSLPSYGSECKIYIDPALVGTWKPSTARGRRRCS